VLPACSDSDDDDADGLNGYLDDLAVRPDDEADDA
jgi:hypothetical protein